jgi:hypothetical protein
VDRGTLENTLESGRWFRVWRVGVIIINGFEFALDILRYIRAEFLYIDGAGAENSNGVAIISKR